MVSTKLKAAALLLIALSCATYAQIPVVRSTSTHRDQEVEGLIDKLVNFGSGMNGTEESLCSSRFLAIDEVTTFGRAPLAAAEPRIDPNLKRLIQIGVRALPALLEHLSDSRATKCVYALPPDNFRETWFADEYDPRYLDPKRQPPVNKIAPGARPPVRNYTFKVGDVCFVAIGQIVNRPTGAFRYQPTNCGVINAPTHTPTLAAAERFDWSGLTKAEHAKQLEDDAYSLVSYVSVGATKRLLYYYPAVGKRVALRLLNRKFYYYMAIWNFADDQLMATDSVVEWTRLVDEAKKKFGPEAVKLLPYWLHFMYWETNMDHAPPKQNRATMILKTLFPDYSEYRNTFYNVVDLRDQADLVKGLQSFPGKAIDAAVQKVFERMVRYRNEPSKNDDERLYRNVLSDDLALACAERIVGKGFDTQYLSYFRGREAEIEKTPKKSEERNSLDIINIWNKKLSPG
ncbi:MAG TPA: hypothetical protein VGL56_01560 [Fimbriimonadaceae bacterium]